MKLLFVCSGNINRSPMAAAIAEAQGDQIGLRLTCRSAGTLGIVGQPAAPNAIYVCREIGIDLSHHVSQGLSEELLDWADKIIVMELEHAAHLRACYERHAHKTLQLGPFGGYADIPDPHRGWSWRYRRCRRQLEACIAKMLPRLA